MNLTKLLHKAGVPNELHEEALASLATAKSRNKGLTLHKLNVKLLQAGKLAKLIPWEAERLLDVRPDMAAMDVEPMIQITAHGDNGPWEGTPQGDRPSAGNYLDKNPDSEEYKRAVASNYWCKGEHPRSQKSVKAWYRRNGGAYEAYTRGEEVSMENYEKPWESDGVKVTRNGKVWQIEARTRLFGIIPGSVRYGFEIGNVFSGIYEPQAWYPIANHKLKAPVTWSFRPFKY